MRLAGALLVSLGAHLAALSAAERLAGTPMSAAAGGSAAPPALRVALDEAGKGPPPPAERRAAPRLPLPKRYFPTRELDSRPQIMTHVMPKYPDGLVSGARGRVVLQLRVGSDGRVDGVRVEHAHPAGVFDAAAVEAFSQARFSPGKKDGAAVPALLRIEVRFGD